MENMNAFYIFALLSAIILITLTVSILAVRRAFSRNHQLFLTRGDKGKCTVETEGTVVRYKPSSDQTAGMVWVSYMVDGKEYTIGEPVHFSGSVIRMGKIPIGQKMEAKLGAIRVGMKVSVLYDPQKPSQAYIPQNEGHITN